MKRVVFSAQFLDPQAGGIARVSRLSLQALEAAADVQALCVEDCQTPVSTRTPVQAFSGSRMKFALANNLKLVTHDAAIYDFAGTARAHLFPFRPYAVWFHGNEIWNEKTIRADYAAVLRKASLVIANSSWTIRSLNEALPDLKAKAVCWLATENDDEPETRDTALTVPRLLFVGRSDRYFAKGQDILVDIWPQVIETLPNARLTFIGGGESHDRLGELVNASPAKSHIDVLGIVPEAEMGPHWKSASALALLGTLEGFGLVVVEAMRHGLPVLVSTQDAACEINIDKVTGFSVDRNDREEVCRSVLALLGDRQLNQTMGAQAKALWRREFTPGAFRRRFLTILGDHLDIK